MRDPVVGLSVAGSLRGGWADALLGAGFLSRFRVRFDYAAGRMWLTPRPDMAREGFDGSGAYLVAENGVAVVADAAPDSALMVGDRLRGTLSEARRAFEAPPERKLRIKVLRHGHEQEIEVPLRVAL
jgi:hypothetical protein